MRAYGSSASPYSLFRWRVRDQRQGGVMLSRHLDAVGPVRQGDADQLAIETDPFDRRQLCCGRTSPPSPRVRSREPARIVASSEQGLLLISSYEADAQHRKLHLTAMRLDRSG